MKILIVDDSRVMRSIVTRTLRQAGYDDHDVVQAGNGVEALDVMADEQPDLVLCDWNMPEMNGIDFVRNLRTHGIAALREVPVILLTANKDELIRQRAMEVGVSAFTVKPISRDQLTTTVRKYLKLEEPLT